MNEVETVNLKNIISQLIEEKEIETGEDWSEMTDYANELSNIVLNAFAAKGWQLQQYCYFIEQLTHYGQCGDSDEFKYAALITTLTPDQFMDELRKYANELPKDQEFCHYKFLYHMHQKNLGIYRSDAGYSRLDDEWQGVRYENITKLTEAQIYSKEKFSEIIQAREEAKRKAAEAEAERKRAEAERQQKLQEEKERAEFERLKKKFG